MLGGSRRRQPQGWRQPQRWRQPRRWGTGWRQPQRRRQPRRWGTERKLKHLSIKQPIWSRSSSPTTTSSRPTSKRLPPLSTSPPSFLSWSPSRQLSRGRRLCSRRCGAWCKRHGTVHHPLMSDTSCLHLLLRAVDPIWCPCSTSPTDETLSWKLWCPSPSSLAG